MFQAEVELTIKTVMIPEAAVAVELTVNSHSAL